MQHHLTSSNSWSWQIRSKSKQYIYTTYTYSMYVWVYIYIYTHIIIYVRVCVLDCVCQCLSQLWRAARYATSMMAWFSASTLPGHMWVALTQTWTCRIHMLHMLTARTSSWLYAFLRNLISKSPFANSSKEIVPDPSWKPSESLTIFKISIFDGSWLGNARMHDNHRDL